MKLSKILYIIISFIFLMIFVGNFLITLQNTKSYLQEESATKAQDAATSLGMTIKSMIHNKKDADIALTINAISDRGFYKEIRLEDAFYTFDDKDLILENENLDGLSWNITDVKIDKKYGELIISNEDNLQNQLDELEGDNANDKKSNEIQDNIYTFIPSPEFAENKPLEVFYAASLDNRVKKTKSNMKLSKILVINTRDVKFDNVPSWFIDLINIQIDEKSTQISDGWKITAVLYVSANPGIAYEKLYIQLQSAFWYSIFAFIVSIIILYFFLKLILNPLTKIEKLAHSISKCDFKQIASLPFAKELKIVTLAMNGMSLKIKNLIDDLNKNIQIQSDKLNTDELTSLPRKQSFLADVKNMFVEKKDGYIAFVKIENLAEYSKVNDVATVNKYIKEFANILKENKSIHSYRIFGSEFAFITYVNTYHEINTISNNLKVKLDILSSKINQNSITHLGLAKFNKFSTVDLILNSSKEAYKMAIQVGPNESYIKDNDDISRDMTQWKELIYDIIDNSKFTLEYIGDIICFDKNEIIMKEAFSSMKDNDTNIPIGTFVSIAQEYNKIIDFDLKVVSKVVKYIKQNSIKYNISINLSSESIKDNEFKTEIVNILKQNENIASQLVFSITAYNIKTHKNEFINFTKIIQKFGAAIMIKRYEAKFIATNEINQLKPDYIRLARDYTSNIHNENTKKDLVDSICKISSLLNIKVYAENVKNENDFKLITQLNLQGASK